jgi:hypothetical protein
VNEEAAMSNRLGVLEICCDAPPYPIVHACRDLDIRDPEDVRWCRLSHFRRRRIGWRELLHHRDWKALLGLEPADRGLCSCQHPLPVLVQYRFVLARGEEVSYALGQCPHCLTVFWE